MMGSLRVIRLFDLAATDCCGVGPFYSVFALTADTAISYYCSSKRSSCEEATDGSILVA